VLGGVTVLVDLHPIAVQSHLLLSMVLVANATVLVRRAGEPDGVERHATVSSATRAAAFAVAAGTSLAVFTGTLVTGAGPHAGDEDVRRFGFHIPTVARIPRHDGDGDDRHCLGSAVANPRPAPRRRAERR
jgi:cytochrome c oxidase assembly protein subunit 15